MAETLDFLLGNYIEKNPERYVDYIPTGFDVLDKALGGGFPNECPAAHCGRRKPHGIFS